MGSLDRISYFRRVLNERQISFVIAAKPDNSQILSHSIRFHRSASELVVLVLLRSTATHVKFELKGHFRNQLDVKRSL
jgi:hypothetical protein